jgi:hypothetical protein
MAFEGLFYRLKSALADAQAPELFVAESPPQSDNQYFHLDGELMTSFSAILSRIEQRLTIICGIIKICGVCAPEWTIYI